MKRILEQLDEIAEGGSPKIGFHLHDGIRKVLSSFDDVDREQAAREFKMFLEDWEKDSNKEE